MFNKLLDAIKNVVQGLPEHANSEQREVSQTANMWRRQSFTAAIIKACTACNAPGRYLSEERVKEGWPGCYVASTDERSGEPVGGTCPNCGTERPADRELGEIWKREFG